MLDAYVAAGHNFLDTADVYGDGTSEQTLAPWLARRRDEVVVATKVRFAVSDPGGSGLAPSASRRRACSLRRLGINVIDLYQVHAPDPDVALEDTLAALDSLVRAGKVRALGASNFPAWLLAWAVGVQDREGRSPFVSLQPQYSLVERSIEVECCPSAAPPGSGCCPGARWGPGFLTRPLPAGGESRPTARASATPGTTSRRRSTGAAPRATSPPWRRPRRRRRDRGDRPAGRDRVAARASRASPRRSSARARSSNSRTCCPQRSWR